jgi:hypothetical protein
MRCNTHIKGSNRWSKYTTLIKYTLGMCGKQEPGTPFSKLLDPRRMQQWFLGYSCVDLNSLRNIRYPAEWTGVNVPVVFRMKIKISKSRLSLLISGIICLNLLNKKWKAGFTYFYFHSENDRYIHTCSLSRVPNIA